MSETSRVRGALASTPLFSGLESSQLDLLADVVQDRRYSKGQTLFLEGSDATGLFVVVKGQVRIYKSSAEGKEHVLAIMGEGQPVGEVALFSGKRYPATAEAIVDCECAFLSRVGFVDLIGNNPQLALSMIATLSERLRKFTQLVEGLSLKEVPARLAEYLLGLSGQRNTLKVELSMAKGQLAAHLGTAPETLSRCLTRLKDTGVIEVEKRVVTILDIDKLEELASGEKLRP